MANSIDWNNIGAGGSPAAREFREQLAREGGAAAHNAEPVRWGVKPAAAVEPAHTGPEARVHPRKKVNGRAQLTLADGSVVSGKMLDLSLSGASVLLEDRVALKQTYALECAVFAQGKRQVFQVQARAVYAVLVSFEGFRLGFEWTQCSPAAQKTLQGLLAE